MRSEIRSEDLHAGDWVERAQPDSHPIPVTVLARGRLQPDGKRRFITGTGRDGREDLLLAPHETVVLLAAWPNLPDKYVIKGLSG